MRKTGEKNITDLVYGCKNRDQNAQYLLYQKYADAMYATSFRLVQNKEDAEDIIQNSFIKVFTNIQQLKSPERFGAWLKQIVVNKSLNSLRQKKITFLELSENITEEEPDFLPEVETKIIKAEIQLLPTGCRTIFTLHLIEEYKHFEIAEMLDISVSTSKSQYARAKKLLKEKLQKIIDGK